MKRGKNRIVCVGFVGCQVGFWSDPKPNRRRWPFLFVKKYLQQNRDTTQHVHQLAWGSVSRRPFATLTLTISTCLCRTRGDDCFVFSRDHRGIGRDVWIARMTPPLNFYFIGVNWTHKRGGLKLSQSCFISRLILFLIVLLLGYFRFFANIFNESLING